MDRLIKHALEERAADVTVPADAWDRQKTLLLASGVAHGRGLHRPWWRRWGTVFEVAAVGVLMLGLIAAGVTYGPLRTGQQRRDRSVAPPASDDLNPQVSPPATHVVVSPDLPEVTPPAGSKTQEQIIAGWMAAVSKDGAVWGGQVTLTGIGLVDGMWELEARGDGRAFTFSHGPRPNDPRKGVYSHVVPLGRLTYRIDAATGDMYSIGSTGGALSTHRTDLEHYRGFIVSGGEQVTLRLVRADGGREGRDLKVWVPGQALSEGGLALWQLNYGIGKQIDVWGLTAAPGEVLAYRLQMNDRPGENLLDHDLMHGIPLPDGAQVTKAMYQNGAGYVLEGSSVTALKAWYEKQMPRYGWQIGKPVPTSSGEVETLRFVTYGWQYAEVAMRPSENGLQFTLTWGMTRLGNQDQAVSAVFRELGDDPVFQQFPRIVGTTQGKINIGGPAPGVSIPATFETRVRTLADGAWEMELVQSWAQGRSTTWRFRVEQDGVVHSLGRSGDQPPAIP